MKAVKFNCLQNNRTSEYTEQHGVWHATTYKKQVKAINNAVDACHKTLNLVKTMLDNERTAYSTLTQVNQRKHPFVLVAVQDNCKRWQVEYNSVLHTLHQLEAIRGGIFDRKPLK